MASVQRLQPNSPSPDALRLSRLDRLIDQLGEHQLTIRQQGVSVVDIAERLKNLEGTVQTELQSLWPLKEVDVKSELCSARSALEKLSKQFATLSREQEEIKAQQAAQLQRLEQRQAATELQVERLAGALDVRLQALADEQGAALSGLRDFFSTTLSQVIGSVADQFDAVQQALDEAIRGRAKQQEEQGQAARLVQESLAAQREWVEAQTAAAHDQAGAAAAAAARLEQRLAAQEVWREGAAPLLAECADQLEGVRARVAQAEEGLEACREHTAQQDGLLGRLSERMEDGERQWRRLAQGPPERLGELEGRLGACEAALEKHSAAGMVAAWETLRAELEASAAKHEQQQSAALDEMWTELAAQRGSCEASVERAVEAAQQAQQACAALGDSLSSLASEVAQQAGQGQQGGTAAAAAAAAVDARLEEWRQRMEQQQAEAGPAAAEELSQLRAGLEQWRWELKQQSAALEERLGRLEAREASGELGVKDMKAPDPEWQQGIQQQLEGLFSRLATLEEATASAQQQTAAKMDEYKSYVKRLRKEVQQLASGQECSTADLVALRQEFSTAQDRMERLHMDAMDLAGEMERTAGAALSLHTTLRGGWQRGPSSKAGAACTPGSVSLSGTGGGGGPGLGWAAGGSPGVERGEIPAVRISRVESKADSALDTLDSTS